MTVSHPPSAARRPEAARPDERPRIRVLPPEVAARIAAGEVIERPASVVKELVENALDAGARRVEVALEGGGATRIRVTDDGHGIPPDQLPDAFERHATSKLRAAEDLFAVHTLGFRGEALAAVVAAADVDFTTRPPAEDAAATARFRGGRPQGGGAAAAAPGTSVEVRELFGALPARRRFLRDARAEARAVAAVLTDWAIARPDVAFRLESEARSLLTTPGDGSLANALAAIHGVEVARALLPLHLVRTNPPFVVSGPPEARQARSTVRGERGEAEASDTSRPPTDAAPSVSAPATDGDGARVEVGGAVAGPEVHRANRRALHLVINGRTVTSRTLLASIEQAYAGLLPAGRHPVGVVRIEVPLDQVDVNVHPQKAEVRLRHERFVAGAVHHAVRAALLEAGPRSLAGFAGFAGDEPASATGTTGARAILAAARPAPAYTRDATPTAEAFMSSIPPAFAPASPFSSDGDATVDLGRPSASLRVAPSLSAGLTTSEAAPSVRSRTLSPLRPLGQFAAGYLIAEAADGLYLVDQHAAHERILYEQVLAARSRGTPDSQPLLEVLIAPLSPAAAVLAMSQHAALEALGWDLEATDGAALLVRAVPAAFARRDPARALADYLDQLDIEDRRSTADAPAAALACKAAVRAGDRLEAAQQRALLEALESAEQPQTCPHGRPTLLVISHDALDRAFARPERARRRR